VSLVTNGVLLDKDKSEGLLDARINHIVISVTGISPDIYACYQGNGKVKKDCLEQLELVKSNISKLVALRNNKRANTQIGISYVLHDDSRKELFQALNYYHNLGIDYVDVRVRIRFLGFNLTGDDIEDYIDSNKALFDANGGFCTCFGKVMNVSTDGTIRFCNCPYIPENIIGNIFEQSLADIICSRKFQLLMEAFHKNYECIPDYCKVCDLGRARPILA
jgi:MoaA/NifB/PqqE/SkfB family radical SAM enzyme